MVIWAIFKNHLLEVGLTQNQENMALRMFTTVDLFYDVLGQPLDTFFGALIILWSWHLARV